MRIAIDARAYFQRTGIARYTRGLVSALASQPAVHEFLLLISDHHRPDELSLPPHVTVQVSHAPWLGGDEERRTLRREAGAWGAALFHSIFPPIAFDDLSSIVTIFDVTPLTHPHLHREVVCNAFSRAWADLCSTNARLAAVSNATRAAILASGTPDPDPLVIGIGVSPPFDRCADEPSEAREGVLFVGTLEPRKNAPLVVDAVRLLADRGLDVTLTLVGKAGWGDQTWYESLTRRGRIRCVGRVDDEELLELYRQAAVLVCPSEVEGFGLPVLEAMSQGVVPIVSATPALLELVGDARFAVEINAAAIADATASWLLDTDARAEASRQLLERARTFTWPDIAAAWMARYPEVSAA